MNGIGIVIVVGVGSQTAVKPKPFPYDLSIFFGTQQGVTNLTRTYDKETMLQNPIKTT